ncbi:HmuY family protein [Longimicrobium sp.]|uniref:HmuY family protein n=1 Tax=Longimicrobium sp. TaxID=2029185 RepID=UPI002E363D8C|nr:HmuY family protein [Longimicrobium sp.]HEX6037632.1 HmuY family protein [Longimicrobium sp.]
MDRRLLGLTALVLLASACDGSPTGEGGIDQPGFLTVTLDGSAGWAYADLDAAAPAVTVANPATNTAWDIAVNATSVMLNGGQAGPGGVLGWCLCQNESATNDQVKAFTAESQLAAFTSTTAAVAPADPVAWKADSLASAITGWWSYNPTTHVVSANPAQVYYVRTAEGTAFAKLRVVALTDPQRAHAGKVTLEYALQASASAPLGGVKQVTVDVAGGRAYLDLGTGAAGTATDWDIALEGYDIRVNGGASGGGQAGAVLATEPFDAITNAASPPASVFKGDSYGGVFKAQPWYRYNLTGSDHQVWPTFNVYLLRRGATLFKVQVTSYYGPAGETRRITLRYAKLAG